MLTLEERRTFSVATVGEILIFHRMALQKDYYLRHQRTKDKYKYPNVFYKYNTKADQCKVSPKFSLFLSMFNLTHFLFYENDISALT